MAKRIRDSVVIILLTLFVLWRLLTIAQMPPGSKLAVLTKDSPCQELGDYEQLLYLSLPDLPSRDSIC